MPKAAEGASKASQARKDPIKPTSGNTTKKASAGSKASKHDHSEKPRATRTRLIPKEVLHINDMHIGLEDIFKPNQLKKPNELTLKDVYDSDKYRGRIELTYEYDHGDGWEHHIAFLGREDPSARRSMGVPAENQVVCLAGEGHPCAEDCGGPPGWDDLKDLVQHPRKKDEDDRRGWYKRHCGNGDPKGLDPYKWNILDVNDELFKEFNDDGSEGESCDGCGHPL